MSSSGCSQLLYSPRPEASFSMKKHAQMETALLSVPASHPTPFSHGRKTSLGFSSSRRITFLSSSSASDQLSLQSESDPDDSSFRGCEACGREEVERGCNGEGRIQGGIATVPGFGWWPIKAFRPCPGFVASGGRYKRRGQSMDEVTSGRSRTEASARAGRKDKSSNSAKG